jgi:hypothetical protein
MKDYFTIKDGNGKETQHELKPFTLEQLTNSFNNMKDYEKKWNKEEDTPFDHEQNMKMTPEMGIYYMINDPDLKHLIPEIPENHFLHQFIKKETLQDEFYVETTVDMVITRDSMNDVVKENLNRDMTDKEWKWVMENNYEIQHHYDDYICSNSWDNTDHVIYDFVEHNFIPQFSPDESK